jgi:hypothetical protein
VKVITIALVASAFALSSTFAVAKTVRHKPPSIRDTYGLQRASIPQIGSRSLYPNYDYGVSAGGYLSNGRSASEAGGG